MNIGKIILELRRQKNITQEELAAELGVTAAAVSKWENGYTLPDILMLCALADHFRVTTDELLGRNEQKKHAVIAVSRPELGQRIAELIKGYGFLATRICGSYAQALEAAIADSAVTHLFTSFDRPLDESEKGEPPRGLYIVESHSEEAQKVLCGFEIYLKNMSGYDTIFQRTTN